MNVHDHLKSKTVPEIKEYYAAKTIHAAIGMTHISGDFNLGNVIRSANFFGFEKAYYVGGSKSYDRRSTVGTHNYIPVEFIRTEEEFIEHIKLTYNLVCIENNIPQFEAKTVSLYDNPFTRMELPPLFLFGEEQLGISEFILHHAKKIITIPSNGTVRSLNVGSCAAIVMAMYRQALIEGLT